MKTKNIIMTVAMGAALVSAPLAKANSISLEVISGTNIAYGTVTGPGTVVFSSANFSGWNVSIAQGTTDPVVGSLTSPVLDTTALVVTKEGGAPLDIIFSGNCYTTADPAGATATISGSILSGTVAGSFDTYYGGALGSETTLLTSSSYSSSTGFSVTTTGSVVGEDGPYILTTDLQILPGSGILSADGGLSVPDGGMTLMMLGTGLVALAGIRSKFGSKLS